MQLMRVLRTKKAALSVSPLAERSSAEFKCESGRHKRIVRSQPVARSFVFGKRQRVSFLINKGQTFDEQKQ